MRAITRREALKLAASLGATLAWRPRLAFSALGTPIERRDLFPQGVASGDPQPASVLLWTRRPPTSESPAKRLRVEVSNTPEFHRLVAQGDAVLASDSGWTARVLAAGLEPHHEYWYRFIDEHSFSSRVGRTITAPEDRDAKPVRFSFVSCQNVQLGACNAYRRMIWEDERRPRAEQFDFVLHLGDFIYEIVWYPEDRPQGYYARRIRDIVRYRDGEKHADFHVPTTVDDYRAVYCAYLTDPDLQDARARWPFVCMPDNHEFSWRGWQSQENFGNGVLPAQTRKVAANQAWFEFQPARLAKPGQGEMSRFSAPRVFDVAIATFDEFGLGMEPGNLAAIGSLRPQRALRWGKNVDLILTDNRSHRSQPLGDRPETAPFKVAFPAVVAQDVTEILDAGREYDGGRPPATIRFGGNDVPNPRRADAPLSMLGAEQKRWFLERLRTSRATWKLWGNSVAGLDWRFDPQNLPPGVGPAWPSAGYALLGDDDWSGYRHERAEIHEYVRRGGITGLATLCGDRHAFLAGELSPSTASARGPRVAAEFVTGSISAPGLAEAMEYGVSKTSALRPIYAYDPPDGSPPQPAINLAITHGVRSSLALARTHDHEQMRAARNRDVAPNIAFADVGGHGYAVVRAGASSLDVEFVCLPRPIARSERPDGGDIAYRITHRTALWRRGEEPLVVRGESSGALPLGSVNPREQG